MTRSPKTIEAMVFLLLGLFVTSAFFIRLDNFEQSRFRSIDEFVYFHLGEQLTKDPFDYNTIPYGNELRAQGRELPEYFSQPLYKYPPVFAGLLALSMKIFGTKLLSAYYVSLLMSVLTIPLVYFLGKVLYNRTVGLAAAFFLFIDPISIVTAQKVWLDTTLAFFSLLSVLSFVLALPEKNHRWFLLSGIACGLATSTKYPGILLDAGYLYYALFYDRQLFKNGGFLSCVFLPFVMLVPWVYWNYLVYGWELLSFQLDIHSNVVHKKLIILKGAVLLILMAMIGAFYLLNKMMKKNLFALGGFDEARKQRLRMVLGGALTIILAKYVYQGMTLGHIPAHGWQQQLFANELPIFYLGKLIEFSPVYLLSYWALVGRGKMVHPGNTVIKVIIVMLLLFYTFWENYQSRYVLSVLPLLLVLGAHQLYNLAQAALAVSPGPSFKRILALGALLLFVGYVIIRTNYLNEALIFPNDFCYY